MADDEQMDDAAMFAAFDNAFSDVGFAVDGYEIIGEIDRGGMGAVYHARQLSPQRDVALKVMLPRHADDAEMRERFSTEARAMAQLDHPGVLPVYEVGETDGMPYFSMKLAEGGTLAQKLAAGEALDVKVAVDWLIAVCGAVQYAHEHGVLHRDLKPGNLLFDDRGALYVADFGVAKMLLESADTITRTQSLIGTPHYMPPELAAGTSQNVTTAGDQYALGAILYECLTGVRPFDHCTNVAAVLRAIVVERPASARSLRASIPRDLEVICHRAMERMPEQRYSSVAAMRRDLIAWRDGRNIEARPVSLGTKCYRWARRHPLPAVLGAALLVSIVTATILIVAGAQETRERLRESLLDEARAARLAAQPGFRQRVLSLLNEARGIEGGTDLSTEAIAAWAKIDFAEVESALSDDERAVASASEHNDGLIVAENRHARVAGPSEGPWVATVGAETFAIKAEDGELATYLTLNTAGDQLAISGSNGCRVMNVGLGSVSESFRVTPGPVRTAPVFHEKRGQFAISTGGTRSVRIFDIAGEELVEIIAPAWPESLAFHPEGELLAVSCSDGFLRIFSMPRYATQMNIRAERGRLAFENDGEHLSLMAGDGGQRTWRLEDRVAFQPWRQSLVDEDAVTVFGVRLSPDGRFLMIETTAGIELWDASAQQRVSFHAAENQRIDAKTEAWWLPGEPLRMLVQVPGSLEVVAIGAAGEILHATQLDRVPGSRVLEVTANGDWIVELLDDDGGSERVLWNGGNSAEECAWTEEIPEQREVETLSADGEVRAMRDGERRICVKGRYELILTPPSDADDVQHIVLGAKGRYLYGITRRNRLCSWDLQALRYELDRLGL